MIQLQPLGAPYHRCQRNDWQEHLLRLELGSKRGIYRSQSNRSCVAERQREIPSPEDDEVLVQISCTGICGSDVHYWKHGRIGDFVVEQPMCLGHESSGTVYELGRSVKRKQPALKVGDRVALEPGSGCGRCTFCVGGSYNVSISPHTSPQATAHAISYASR